MAAGSISTRVPEGRPLKKFTTPPRRTIARACCQVAGLPAASTTESGPSWSSVSALTAGTTSSVSVTLKVATAPSRLAMSSGAARRASAMTRTPRRESMRTTFNPPARIHALPHGHNFANQFVAKDGRRSNHFGVITTLPDFEVSTVGKRQPDAHQDFVSRQCGYIDLLYAKIFAAIEYGCGHLRR